MSHNSFISLVVPISKEYLVSDITACISEAGQLMASIFSDYEIILVDNRSDINLNSLDISDDIRPNCYMVSLAKETVLDLVMLAGFERANGDYVACLDVRQRWVTSVSRADVR